MGRVLEPKVWCRSRACRETGAADPGSARACACAPPALPERVRPEPRLTVLRARATRLAAFACRVCRRASRRMVEYPEMFFRCEECAAANLWPEPRRAGGA